MRNCPRGQWLVFECNIKCHVDSPRAAQALRCYRGSSLYPPVPHRKDQQGLGWGTQSRCVVPARRTVQPSSSRFALCSSAADERCVADVWKIPVCRDGSVLLSLSNGLCRLFLSWR